MNSKLIRSITLGLSLRYLFILIGLITVGLAFYLNFHLQRMEAALRYSCDLPAFEQVTPNCLEEVYVPVNRKFVVVSQRQAVEGLWTVHPVASGEMVHPSQLSPTPPDRFRFTASGQPLPEGTWAYFLTVPEAILNVVGVGDKLTLSVTDPLAHQLIVCFDKVRILDKSKEGIFLGLTMNQVAAIERLREEVSRQTQSKEQPGPELVWTITQNQNPSLPSLAVFRMELTPDTLTGH